MPELPEVEHLRRSIEPQILGRRVRAVRLHRADIVQGLRSAARGGHHPLLAGQTITAIDRRGKQLAILTDVGRALVIQLGMTGQLLISTPGSRSIDPRHIHCRWFIDPLPGASSAAAAAGPLRLVFRDPRRFGRVTAFPSEAALKKHWSRLGPDALTITTADLRPRLAGTTRPIKAALLDQNLIAGVGNIYADELLFAAAVHPCTPAHTLQDQQVRAIAAQTRAILRRALTAGGSTIRDYRGVDGMPGSFASRHMVYGRAGQPCLRCRGELQRTILAQRSTTYCPTCQRDARGQSAGRAR